MDLDNVQIGLDPQSKTGLDPKGKWTPTIEAPLPQINEEVKANATVLVDKLNENLKNAKFNGELKGIHKEKLDNLIKRFENDEVTIGEAITEIGLMNKFGSEFFHTCCMKYFIEHVPATTDELQKMAYQGLLCKHSDLVKLHEPELKVEGNIEENAEAGTLAKVESEEPKKLGLTSDYPKGTVIHPFTIPGLKVFDMSEPDPKYPIEDFELSVTRIYDDGRQEEVQNMVLGWRGSIKGYVKVYEDDTFENYLYGFKQVIKNRKGRKPAINVRIKYHNKLGGLITPVFGKNGDEKISKSDLDFRLC